MAAPRCSSFLRAILLLMVVCFVNFPVQAKYSGGTGGSADPYQIATAEDLMLLGNSPDDYDKHFILTADIDLDPNLPGRKVFDRAVIAPSIALTGDWHITPFSGVFDGKDHTISNLVCHPTDQRQEHVGLFGWVDDQNAEIRNLGLIDPDAQQAGRGSKVGSLVGFLWGGTLRNCYVKSGSVTGYESVGILVGYNNGYMIGCYSEGTVVGELVVGGLVGTNRGHIVNAYSSSMVFGHRDVGGLAGYNAGLIMDCYSFGPVDGDENVGGLLGRTMKSGRSGGSIEINCFWDREASDQTTSAGGKGLDTAEMQDPNTFMQVGWDFVGASDGPNDVWAILSEGRKYPVLGWQLPIGFGLPEFSGGTGKPNDPYLISSADEWNRIGHNPRLMGAHFKLVNDINLAEVESFVIANEYYPFAGVFDGNGHRVANFSYHSVHEDYVGIFGYVSGPNARIEALGVTDINIHVGSGYGIGSFVENMERPALRL